MMTYVLLATLAATPLTLDEVRAASRQNLQALQSQLDLSRAQANSKAARSAIMPSIDASSQVGVFYAGSQWRVSTLPDFDPETNLPTGKFSQQLTPTDPFMQGSFQLGLSITQLLYDGGRWWNQIARSGAQEDAARGQLEEQRLAAELEATRRFYELVRAQLTQKVVSASVDRSREQLRRTRSLFEAGRAQRSAVLDAETNLGNDEIQVLRSHQAIVSASLDLLQWIGRPAEEIEAVVPQEMDLERRPPAVAPADQLISTSKEQRPLVRSLDNTLRANKLGVEVAMADFFPRITAGAGYQRNSPTSDWFFNYPLKQNSFNAGINLSWNIFAGFSTVSQLDTARANVTQAENQQRQSMLDLEAEIRRGYKTLSTQLAIAELASKNRELAEAQLKLESERFSTGTGSTIEVRNAELKLTQAQLTQLQGRIDVEIARAALRRSVGGNVEAAQ